MTSLIFDTHAHHSSHHAFDADRFALLTACSERAWSASASRPPTLGDAPWRAGTGSPLSVVYAAIGIHPESLLAPEDCGEEGPAPLSRSLAATGPLR